MYKYKPQRPAARQVNEYTELANAIIAQAANDYRSALGRIKLNRNDKKAMSEAMECENFFHSSWYGILTNLDGDLLIKKLREEVKPK